MTAAAFTPANSNNHFHYWDSIEQMYPNTSYSWMSLLLPILFVCFLSVCADAPLSADGHRVSAAFEGAAAKLQGSEVKLAVVDVSKEKDLAKDLNVTGPPNIRLYLSGDKHNTIACPGTYK